MRAVQSDSCVDIIANIIKTKLQEFYIREREGIIGRLFLSH